MAGLSGDYTRYICYWVKNNVIYLFICLFVCSFQELDLSPEALLRNETNREEHWIDLVESSLKMAGKFKKVKERLTPVLYRPCTFT